jgi:hypothetical protein
MKKLSKKAALLFAAAMALCAFTMPSIASALSWGPATSRHTLDSPNLGFTTTTAIGALSSQCSRSSFTSQVTSTQILEITTGSFGGCTWSGPNIGDCTATTVGTKFPWTATAVTTSNIQIHGVFIDVSFEQVPGQSNCQNIAGASLTFTGTLTGGNWTGNASHSLDLSNAPGLVSHGFLGNGAALAWRGLITDTANSLTVN